jgi:hypothetical protein
MTEAPARDLLARLAEDCRWPAVTIGRLVVWGEAGWRDAVARATPPERGQLVAQLGRQLLVASAGGRARLRRWLDDRPPPAPSMPTCLLPQWLRERVLFYGDGCMLGAVIEALILVPAPVRAAVLTEVAFLAVGAETRAWTGSAALVRPDGRRPTRLVMLSGADRHAPDLVRTVLHECGHAWSAPLPREGEALATVHGEGCLLALARRDGWADRADGIIDAGERLAEGLALAWIRWPRR